MTVKTSHLELQWRDRAGVNGRTARCYIDFVVDGKSLFQLIQADLIGRLGWLSPTAEQESIFRLLLKLPPDLKNERYLLYICPECGDISCGAVTIAIEETPEYFIWRDFGYENDYEDSIHSLEQFSSISAFYFEKHQYQQVFQTYARQTQVEPLPKIDFT